jgi:hypothetical protein
MVQGRRCNEKRKSLRKRGGTKSQKSRKSGVKSRKSGVKSVAFKSVKPDFDPIYDYIHWAASDRRLEKLTKEHPSIHRTEIANRLKQLAVDYANKIKAARDYLENNPRGKVGIVYYLYTPGRELTINRIEPDMTKEEFDDLLNEQERYFTGLTYRHGLYPSFTYI